MRRGWVLAGLLLTSPSWAAQGANVNLTAAPVGWAVLALFVLAYLAVMTEEITHLRKSKPVILAAGIIWVLIALAWPAEPQAVEQAVRHYLLEYAELFLFLLVAMTYVNAMSERGVFEALRVNLVGRGLSYRALFWITGVLAFFISPVLDNLTTALVMCAVLMAVGQGQSAFIAMGCINIVVAANAGGAFSPFGDITTLMVWQRGILPFWDFFALFLPAAVNFLVPAALMHFALPRGAPAAVSEAGGLKRGALVVVGLFAATVVTAVCFHNFLHLPPFLGMMTGLAYLQFYGYYLNRSHIPTPQDDPAYGHVGDTGAFDSFRFVAQAEWDTLLFFFGVIMCVGGLGFLGYLELASSLLYGDLGATVANISIGLLSAVVDNIPVMVAVLEMRPDMSAGQWLLVTMTAGVGGSLLSIGSAAGVALMGQARGIYTFGAHLKWTWAIALGYVLSILCHFWVNAHLF